MTKPAPATALTDLQIRTQLQDAQRGESLHVDPTTGVIVPPGTPGSVEIQPPPLTEAQPDSEWLGDWLTRQVVELNAAEAALKAQTALLLGRINARRKHLAWAYHSRLQAVVHAERGKKKSVSFAFGSAGFRASRERREVVDTFAALLWAEDNCPAAVKHTDPRILVSELPAGVDVPGLVVHPKGADVFFVRGAKPTG